MKAALHQKILQLVKRRGPNQGQRRRTEPAPSASSGQALSLPKGVSDPRELMRGKLSTLSVAWLLLYADLFGS
jgi:hypothetical protein